MFNESERSENSTDNFRTRPLWRVVFVLILCFVSVPGTSAFAIEYHGTLIDQTLSQYSFDPDAIRMVQIESFIDDLADNVGSKSEINTNGAKIRDMIWYGMARDLEPTKLSDDNAHFDDKCDYVAVKAEWERLEANTYAAVKKAEEKNDKAGFLATMGMSLHTVEDFYAHSNWAELTDGGNFGGDATWFDVPENERSKLKIHTYCSQINISHDDIHKDFPRRQSYDTAYREAYYASRQWVDLMHSWVSEDFWQSAMRYSPGQTFDYSSSYSWLVTPFKSPTKDPGDVWDGVMHLNWYTGTWNDHISTTSHMEWDVFRLEFLNDQLPLWYILEWEDYMRIVGAYATSPPPPDEKRKYSYIPEQRWVRIETGKVEQTDCDWWDIDPGSKADFYSVININNHKAVEAPLFEKDTAVPNKWVTFYPVPMREQNINIKYQLWDDDSALWHLAGDDDHCDINPEHNEEDWTYDGVIAGLPRDVDTNGKEGQKKWCFFRCWGCRQTIGDGDEARAQFQIAANQYKRRLQGPTVAQDLAQQRRTTPYCTGTIPSFTATPLTGRAPLAVSFTDTSGPGIKTWEWDFDNDGTIDSRVQNPTYTYAEPGVYSVTLKTTSTSCDTKITTTKESYVTVDLPLASGGGSYCTGTIPSFNATPVSGKVPLTVSFTDTSGPGIKTWEWDFDNDGTIDSRVQNPTYTYTEPGVYSVTLQTTSTSCDTKLTVTKDAFITAEAAPAITGDPTITGISPSTINRGATVTATVTGTNFASGAEVKIESLGYEVQAAGEQTQGTTQILCSLTVPNDGLTGNYNVYIRNPGGRWIIRSNALQVLGGATHVVTGITPNSATPGTTVQAAIYGTNFPPEAEAAVQYEPTNTWYYATNENYISASELRGSIAIPSDAAIGQYHVYVKNPITGWVYLRNGFTVTPGIPTFTGISPSSVNRGTPFTATVSGTNFASGAEVKIESLGYEVQATGEQTLNQNQIRCALTVPNDGLTGYYNVYVRNPGGNWVYGRNALQVLGGATHVVTGISPNIGEVGSTFTATVYGTNFPPEAEVALQYEPTNTWYQATNENYISRSEIRGTFAIPQNAAIGKYHVYVRNPVTGWVYLRNGFTVNRVVS